jgi:cytochrome c oxidase cbb3-type subunit III
MSKMHKVAIACLMILALGACEREEREYRPDPAAEQAKPDIVVSGLQIGPAPPPASDYPEYTANAYHVAEGKRLYLAFNCNGCHAHGGGDIGPPLMDDAWIYGSEPPNIFATIVEGRPNGMPSFRQKIPEQQVWQLVAYVRAMGGFVRKDVAPGRDDDMNVRPPEQSLPRQLPTSDDHTPTVEGTR